MPTDEIWLGVIQQLLVHFDCNEGTTYLYEKSARKAFVAETHFEVRERVSRLLDRYHEESGKGEPLQPGDPGY